MLADILPTSYEVGVLNGRVRPGDTVAIVGAGPIGLAAIMTARLYSPGARSSPSTRPRPAGAPPSSSAPTSSLDAATDDAARRSSEPHRRARRRRRHRGGRRAGDLRAVHARWSGPAATSPTSASTASPATLHLEDLWIKNVTITTGLVDTHTTPTLLRCSPAGQLDAAGSVTHRFGFDEMQEAYDVFARPDDPGALKVAVLRG